MVKVPTANDAGFGRSVSSGRIASQQIGGITEDAFGASQGRALQSVSSGLNAISSLEASIQDEDDALEAQNLDTEYLKAENDLLIGNEENQGYIYEQGSNAVNKYGEVIARHQDIIKTISEKASNNRVRENFLTVAQKRALQAQEKINGVYQKGKEVKYVADKEAYAQQQANIFRTSLGNPTASAQARADFSASYIDIGMKNGLSGLALDSFVNENVTNKLLKPLVEDTIDVNPMAAMNLIERPDIKKALVESGDYQKTKDSIETNIYNIGVKNQKLAQVSLIRSGNADANLAISGKMTASQAQSIFNDPNKSEALKDLVKRSTGFSSKEIQLSREQKAEIQMGVNENVAMFLGKQDKTLNDISDINEVLDSAYSQGAIDINKYTGLKAQVVSKKLDAIEKAIDVYDGVFDNGLGYSRITKFIDKNIQEVSKKDTPTRKNIITTANNVVKDKILSVYYGELEKAAKANNMTVSELDGLDDNVINPILETAYTRATNAYANAIAPNIPQEGMPTKILSNVSGQVDLGGKGDLKTKATSLKGQGYLLGKDNGSYKVKYSNGTIKDISKDEFVMMGGKL